MFAVVRKYICLRAGDVMFCMLIKLADDYIVAGNSIRREGAKSIADALKSNQTLQTLDIGCTLRWRGEAKYSEVEV